MAIRWSACRRAPACARYSTPPARGRELAPEIALIASAPDAVADLAQRGLGVAVLSESMAAAQDGRLRAMPIADIDIASILAFVWRPDPSPALRELLVHARAAFAAPA